MVPQYPDASVLNHVSLTQSCYQPIASASTYSVTIVIFKTMLVHQYSFFHLRNYYLIIRCSTTMHIYTYSFIVIYKWAELWLPYRAPICGFLHIPPHASYHSRRPVYRVISRTNMPQGIVIVVAALLFPYLLFFGEADDIVPTRSRVELSRLQNRTCAHISSYYRSRTLQFFARNVLQNLPF